MTNQQFSKFLIPSSNIFLKSAFSFAFVNLRPVFPGHVLVSPLRIVKRFSDLTDDEAGDLWLTTQRVAKVIESIYQKTCEICIQDGPAAGQTVEHVHVHIVPRLREGDAIPVDYGKLIKKMKRNFWIFFFLKKKT